MRGDDRDGELGQHFLKLRRNVRAWGNAADDLSEALDLADTTELPPSAKRAVLESYDRELASMAELGQRIEKLRAEAGS